MVTGVKGYFNCNESLLPCKDDNDEQTCMLISVQLVDDPIFIPVSQLEQDKDGHPAEFSKVEADMKAGKTGHLHIQKARKGRRKVSFEKLLLTNG